MNTIFFKFEHVSLGAKIKEVGEIVPAKSATQHSKM